MTANSAPNRHEKRKLIERYRATEAASKLGVTWELEDREAPDFLVHEGRQSFGLEVTECHIGLKTKRGAQARSRERANQRWLDDIRAEFKQHTDAELHLRYYGSTTATSRRHLLDALIAARFDERADLDMIKRTFDGGSVYAAKSPYASWICLNDRVGWVSSDGGYLQREIDAKAANLARYRSVCSDIRLLVVADRIYNSGKLQLDEDFRPDLRGFNAVYFFAYPLSVTPFFSD